MKTLSYIHPTYALGLSVMLLTMFVFTTVHADTLNRQLEEGDSGADVSLLQTFLGQDPTIYPEALVTGYFGSLTKSAVSKFQARNGIATVGRVGPVTLVALNGKMGSTLGSDISAPKISSVTSIPGSTAASIQWSTNEQAAGIVYYSTSWPTMSDSITDVTIGGTVARTDTTLRMSQSVSISGLQSNTTYYYVIYARDASGNVQMTWPTTFRTTN